MSTPLIALLLSFACAIFTVVWSIFGKGRDVGRGIEERYLPRVFERYFKVPDAGRNISGTGLGLAIAKDFIEAQGGKIGVESRINEGSRFYFLLPVSLI